MPDMQIDENVFLNPQASIALQRSAEQQADAQLFVEFKTEAVFNQQKSNEAGRAKFDDEEYISIIVPGDKTSSVFRPANDGDRRRFPLHYKAYKEDHEQLGSGTPIEQLPISPGEVKELRWLKIRTVEQLADANASTNVGGISHFKNIAKAFLKSAAGFAPVSELESRVKAIENEKTSVANQLKDALETIKQLQAMVEAKKK